MRIIGSKKTQERAKALLDKINSKKKEEPSPEPEQNTIEESLPEPDPISVEESTHEAEPETEPDPVEITQEQEEVELYTEPEEEIVEEENYSLESPNFYNAINKTLPTFLKCPCCGLKMKPNSLIFILNVANNRGTSDCKYKLVACPKKECGCAFVIDKDYSVRGF